MSLITRCPACGTMFKVVPDQLRISEGWVRCGHCAEVFDATASLQSFAPEELAPIAPGQTPQTGAVPAAEPAAPAPPAPPPAAPPSAPAAATSPAATVSPPAAIPQARTPPEPDFDLDSLLPPDPGSAVEPSLPPEPAMLAGPDSAAAMPLSAQFPASMPPADATASSPALRVGLPEGDAAPAPTGSRTTPAAEDTDEDVAAQEASFVQDARRKARWRSTPVRVGLAFLVLLLAGVLAGQVAYQERDRLAVWQPALKPLLTQGCEWLGCVVGPVRQIEAVAIESSAFQRIRGDAYRLSLSLRNQSDWPVAMPAIELTLTDAVDQPVVRRVLTPAELGSASGVLAPQSEQPATAALAVAASAGQARVAGYRILAFYP